MKKFEILSHTADIKATVYGEDIETLFENSSEALSFITGFQYSDTKEETIRIKISADNLEDLLVKFLNELIYYAEVKRKAGKVSVKKIYAIEKENVLVCKIEGRSVSGQEIEIKAATYHNLKIEKQTDMFAASIFFDV